MFKKIAIVSAGLIAAVAAVIFLVINHELNEMEIDTGNIIARNQPADDTAHRTPLPAPQAQAKEEKPEDFYTMVIGLDIRENLFLLNTDALIVAHIIPQNHTVRLLSIPRDQRVTAPDGHNAKVNAIFAEGYNHAVREARKNPDLLSGKRVTIGGRSMHEEYVSSGIAALRETLEQFLDISIDYSFIVNFQTLVELVDAVGGIEINVDRDLHYTTVNEGSIHLQKGLQVLSGEDALGYVRHRMDDRGEAYWSSDFDRGRRQQEVIAALANKIASWNNIGKAMNLLDIVTSNIKTDMKRTKMISLLTSYYGVASGDSIISVPYPGEWKNPYVELSDEQKEIMLREFKSIGLTAEKSGGTNPGSGTDHERHRDLTLSGTP